MAKGIAILVLIGMVFTIGFVCGCLMFAIVVGGDIYGRK